MIGNAASERLNVTHYMLLKNSPTGGLRVAART